MATNPLPAASPAKLIFVDDDLPGITRHKAGRGWYFRDPDGKRIADQSEIARLNSIALPPAYTDTWYCPAPNGHILATGMDARGRKQYRYHPDFRAQRESEKFDGTVAFGRMLPLVRKRVENDLKAPRPTYERAIASVVRLLDATFIRIGNERYARENGSFGASTLRMKHVSVTGTTLRLRYRAKSGKRREMTVSDRGLARFVKKMQDLPGQHLFQYLEQGDPRPVTSCDVNEYLRETMGADFTAKHFRTWHASAIGFEELAEARDQITIKVLAQQVSDLLGNTPTVARASYIHPRVIDLVDCQQEWRAGLCLPRRTRWLSRYERGLIEMLEGDATA
ncbi:MAG: DNA topoisomerase IB [Novosphingobium sp.]|nr:DNA topoisomerase IB [Novosphingobium sp.]